MKFQFAENYEQQSFDNNTDNYKLYIQVLKVVFMILKIQPTFFEKFTYFKI